MKVRVRFAPSPTGFLHIGSVRTALFNWLPFAIVSVTAPFVPSSFNCPFTPTSLAPVAEFTVKLAVPVFPKV